INFWLAQDQLSLVVHQILERGTAYGRSEFGVGLKINVEFVSANPTGPLHVGHGRGAAYGDAIASLFQWTGHSVTREFYINDAGVQIDKLALSLWARVQHALGREAEVPEGGYYGLYLAGAAVRAAAARRRRSRCWGSGAGPSPIYRPRRASASVGRSRSGCNGRSRTG